MSARGPVSGGSTRERILEPIRRALRWMLAHRDGSGAIVCPEHRVEHTGKSAGAIVIACELLRLDPGRDDAFLLDAAVGQARRLVLNLVREGTSECHTFRPGRYDPFNCSNHVIDGGACSDALAHVVTALGPRLAARDREAFERASVLHARTYLRYAVLDKGVPAQRAWGLTGLAGAFALSRDPELERAALEAVGQLEAIQHADGSYPYHPVEWGAEHEGASDVSAFYQSRVTGFLFHALERMGRDPASELFREPLGRGLELLLALQGPDGIKCGLVEAKPWYWGASYEVASHPFDVYALCAGWRRFGRERLARAALASFRAWVDHLGADGMPSSHRPGPGRERSYQCPMFWAAHAMWLARAAEDLERIAALGEPAATPPGSLDLAAVWFASARLARLDDPSVAVWIRGGRPASNVHHGSPRGAGLLRVYDKVGKRDLLDRDADPLEAEWIGAAGLPSIARGMRSGGSELAFSVWLARVHARAGRFGSALAAPWRVFRRGVLAFGSSAVGSEHDHAPEVLVRPDGVIVRSKLARRDGTPIDASALERTYRIDGEGLAVEERLLADGGARGVRYRVPRAAADVARAERDVRYRLGPAS